MTDIRDKLRKLRAKSEDSACTEQEAQTYADKLQKLLSEHSLSMSDIQDVETEYQEDRQEIKYSSGWRRNLADSVGRFMGAAFSFTPGTDWGSFTGLPHHTAAAWELFRYLERSCVTIPRTRFPHNTSSARRAEKGVAVGLCERLYRMRQQLPEARALVPMEHANAKAAQDRMMPGIKSKDLSQKIDSKEAYAGYRLADTVQIQDEVKS